MNQKRYNRLFLLAGIVVVLVVGAVVGLYAAKKTQVYEQQIATNVSPTPTLPQGTIATGDGSYAVATNVSNKMKFISPKLGISFLYIAKDGSTKINVKEVDNKITLSDPYFSQSIEVFDKSPRQSLTVAIQKSILKGYSEKNCFLKSINSYQTPADEEYVYIDFPLPTSYDQQTVVNAASKCPTTYTQLSDVKEFMMNKNHTKKFFFLDLGQTGPTWEPIQFLN